MITQSDTLLGFECFSDQSFHLCSSCLWNNFLWAVGNFCVISWRIRNHFLRNKTVDFVFFLFYNNCFKKHLLMISWTVRRLKPPMSFQCAYRKVSIDFQTCLKKLFFLFFWGFDSKLFILCLRLLFNAYIWKGKGKPYGSVKHRLSDIH